MWEEFHSLALPLLGQHFPPNLVKDNGDSILFVDRRERLRFLLTENARGITGSSELSVGDRVLSGGCG